ncbi:hypothetical protein A2446_02600 [Candidatus Roizmanbacteria bacterium RIFOXYC2_FULL_38_9]|nr:MAG: hypothetical protein A3K21_06130 [Candidatus Roizmanbacteria bacterium RIFOXYC1_FULL_38_14]OGK73034.1 MAG: hypothetical protein A2446_02600 [Candidatus Roizmanbacteria bacterium RIFOXYC2_FULL_38_9]
MVKQLFRSCFNFGKKAIIVLIVYAFIIGIFASFFSKNKPQYNPKNVTQLARKQIYKALNNKELNAKKSGKIALFIYRMHTCFFSGEACTDNPSDGDKNVSKSVSGYLSKLITIPFANPPASGIYWVYTNLQDAGFVPKSYASEGMGFGAIKPLMNVWKIFRDIAYLILVIILVSIGFMIMFRTKINPQTVISVENALPKIVTSLLLITFSFAIAGFLIDLMYILIAIIISILSNGGANYDVGSMQNEYLSATPWNIYLSFQPIRKNLTGISGDVFLGTITDVGTAFMTLFPTYVNNVFRLVSGAFAGFFLIKDFSILLTYPFKVMELVDNMGAEAATFGINLGKLVGSTLLSVGSTTLFAAIFAYLMLYGAGVIIGLVIYFTIIALVFRVFFMLFRAYLQILFLIVTAPLFILIDAIPGKSGFTTWFKNLLAELLTFPVIITVFLVGNVIMNSLAYPGDFWFPPFLLGIDPLAFSTLLGLGIMFMIPDLVKLVKDSLGIKPLPINLGLGTFFGGAGSAAGGGLSLVGQISTLSMGLSAITGKTIGQMIGTSGMPAPDTARYKAKSDNPTEQGEKK